MGIRGATKLALLLAGLSQVALFGAYWLATGGCFCATTASGPPPPPLEAAALHVLPTLLPANAPADHLLGAPGGPLDPVFDVLHLLPSQAGSWGALLVFGTVNTLAWAAVLLVPLLAIGWLVDRRARRRAGAA